MILGRDNKILGKNTSLVIKTDLHMIKYIEELIFIYLFYDQWIKNL